MGHRRVRLAIAALVAAVAVRLVLADQGAPVYQAIPTYPVAGGACSGPRVQVQANNGFAWCCVASQWVACNPVTMPLPNPAQVGTSATATTVLNIGDASSGAANRLQKISLWGTAGTGGATEALQLIVDGSGPGGGFSLARLQSQGTSLYLGGTGQSWALLYGGTTSATHYLRTFNTSISSYVDAALTASFSVGTGTSFTVDPSNASGTGYPFRLGMTGASSKRGNFYLANGSDWWKVTNAGAFAAVSGTLPIQGVADPVNPTDAVPRTYADRTYASLGSIPDCHGTNDKLTFNATTRTFGCGTDLAGGTGNSATGALAFGCETGGNCGADAESPTTTTLTAAWATSSSSIRCVVHGGTADHPAQDDDPWVEGVQVQGIPGAGTIDIRAWAWNYTWGNWNVTCEEL